MMSVIHVGQTAELTRVVSLEDFSIFSDLSGDKNPIHTDRQFAASTRFGRVIAPGLLIGSFVSAAIANQLPGPGSIYMSQTFEFKKPVYENETIHVKLRVEEILRKDVCRLSTICENDHGEIVVSGVAVVKHTT